MYLKKVECSFFFRYMYICKIYFYNFLYVFFSFSITLLYSFFLFQLFILTYSRTGVSILLQINVQHASLLVRRLLFEYIEIPCLEQLHLRYKLQIIFITCLKCLYDCISNVGYLTPRGYDILFLNYLTVSRIIFCIHLSRRVIEWCREEIFPRIS